MPQRIQLHLAVRGGQRAAVGDRLDALTDRLLQAAALRGAGPARAVGLVHRDLSCAIAGEPRTIMPLEGGRPRPSRYMYVMRRKAGTTHAQYIDYYFHHHKRFGFRAPRHQGYVEFHVDGSASEAAARAVGFGLFRVDSVSEFHLESLAAPSLRDRFNSFGDRAAPRDPAGRSPA